jgi:hypothetical protein
LRVIDLAPVSPGARVERPVSGSLEPQAVFGDADALVELLA